MKTLLTLLLCHLYFQIHAQTITEQQFQTGTGNFIENVGQWNAEALFKTAQSNTRIWLMKDKIRFDYFLIKEESEEEEEEGHQAYELEEEQEIEGHVWDMQLINSNNDVQISGKMKNKQYYNYFIGNDRSHWAGRVSSYKEVWYNKLYHNIDARYYTNSKGNFEFDYIISAGGDVNDIQFKLNGLYDYKIDNENNLVLITSLGEVMQSKPIAWQILKGKKQYLDIAYHISDSVISFVINNNYDKSEAIIIDPELIRSTFLSCPDCNGYVFTSCLNDDGSVTMSGFDMGSEFPITLGSYQTILAGQDDVFVSRINEDLDSLIFSTYIGGTGIEAAFSIIHPNDSIYVIAGRTDGSFPVTDNAYQSTYSAPGTSDGFICGLSADGDSLLFSTYLGGPFAEFINEINADDVGNIYGTGICLYTFLTTEGVIQPEYGGGTSDAFVFKLNPDASELLFSTYLGGDSDDEGRDLIVSEDRIYITGSTHGNFLITDDAYQTILGGYSDAFVTCIDTTGTELFFSTYLGGSNINGDVGNNIDINNTGNIIVGSLAAEGFPVTADAYQLENAGELDFAISELSPDLSELIYSTFIGGPEDDMISGFTISEGKGRFYILGTNFDGSFPLTEDAFDTIANGYEGLLVIMNQGLDSMIYSTYFGGIVSDYNLGTAIKPLLWSDCYLFTPITTHSLDFPTTPGVFQSEKPNYDIDAPAIVKWNVSALDSVFLGDDIFVCSGDVVSLDAGAGFVNYEWSTGDSSQIIYPYESGTYSVTVSENENCNFSDTVLIYFYETSSIDLGNDTTICKGDSLLLSTDDSFVSYAWSTGAVTASIYAYADDMYILTATDANGCIVSDTMNVSFEICDAIETDNSKYVIQVFPNPATNEIIIHTGFINIPEKIELQIYSMNNELVKEKQFIDIKKENDWKLNINDLPSSSFYIVLKTENVILVKKLVKI